MLEEEKQHYKKSRLEVDQLQRRIRELLRSHQQTLRHLEVEDLDLGKDRRKKPSHDRKSKKVSKSSDNSDKESKGDAKSPESIEYKPASTEDQTALSPSHDRKLKKVSKSADNNQKEPKGDAEFIGYKTANTEDQTLSPTSKRKGTSKSAAKYANDKRTDLKSPSIPSTTEKVEVESNVKKRATTMLTPKVQPSQPNNSNEKCNHQ